MECLQSQEATSSVCIVSFKSPSREGMQLQAYQAYSGDIFILAHNIRRAPCSRHPAVDYFLSP